MAKNKSNQQQNKSKQKYRLKNYTLPTPDKSADPPQLQDKIR